VSVKVIELFFDHFWFKLLSSVKYECSVKVMRLQSASPSHRCICWLRRSSSF